MMLQNLSLLVLIAGVLLYGFSSNSRASEIGRLMFFAALLAILFGHGMKL